MQITQKKLKQTKKSGFICKIGVTCLLSFWFCTTTYAQSQTTTASKRIDISLANASLKDLFTAIEKNSSFRFFYDATDVNVNTPVSAQYANTRIDQILKEKLSNFSYEIKGNQIIVKSKPIVTTAAQQAITGSVTDKDGEPVIGANISEKGTQNGTASNVDGKFSLQVNTGAVLVISYIGYTTQEIAVGNQTSLNITLSENNQALDEVVVVGYGTQKKRDLTGAISSIKMSDEPIQTFTNVGYALAGKAAGFQVNRVSAQVGGGTSFKIRGAASTGAGNDPLIIVDGFPVSSGGFLGSGNRYDAGSTDNTLESINPNDIESIEILKDASSTAIYGARAGHGVVIITTKRGKEGKVNVTYSGNLTSQKAHNTFKILDGENYMLQYNRFFKERWLRENGQDIYSNYLPINPNPVPFKAPYSELQILNAETTDWFGEVTRPGFLQTHDLSINGGTATTKYLASLSYTDHAGVIKNNEMSRVTARINLDQKLSNYVTGGLSLNINRNTYENVPLGSSQWENAGLITSAVTFNPTIPVRDAEGNYSINPQMPQVPNPAGLLEITDITNKERIFGSIYAEVEPIKNLKLKAMLGIDRKYQKRKNYLPKTTRYGASYNGQATISQDDRNDYLMDFTATYNKRLNQHNITALLGYSYQKFEIEGFNASNSDFITDAFLFNNIGSGNYPKPTVGSWASMNSLGSYFARLNYSLLDRYLLTATIRTDGASNFNPDHRWGYFPSVSVGWRFVEESFMQSLASVFSNGKIRLSYGQTGNSNIGNRTMDFYNKTSTILFGDSPNIGIRATQFGNPFLTWETTTETNVGLDLGFFDNRISLTAEYFDRTISDLLVSGKSLPHYNELTSTAANIGTTQSNGIELTLNTVNIRNRDWTWTTDFTFATYNDRWKERDPNWKPTSYQKENDPIRPYHAYLSDGILKAGESAPAHQPLLLPGQVKLKDLSGPDGVPDGRLDNYDITLVGTYDPAFISGFNNTVQYKNFDLNIYLYGEFNKIMGGSYYESWAFSGGKLDIGENASTAIKETYGADNLNTNRPSSYSSSYGNGDYFNRKISFVRVRNITLGYTLPIKKSVINKVRVYADVNNPFIFTNWTGQDPETDNHSYAYPNVVGYSFGINVTF
jgi:TonB-linked SusC/RagA family outer membrane protein